MCVCVCVCLCVCVSVCLCVCVCVCVSVCVKCYPNLNLKLAFRFAQTSTSFSTSFSMIRGSGSEKSRSIGEQKKRSDIKRTLLFECSLFLCFCVFVPSCSGACQNTRMGPEGEAIGGGGAAMYLALDLFGCQRTQRLWFPAALRVPRGVRRAAPPTHVSAHCRSEWV